MIISTVNDGISIANIFFLHPTFPKKYFILGNYFFFPVNSLHLVCKAIVGRKTEILVQLFQIVNLFKKKRKTKSKTGVINRCTPRKRVIK